MAGGRTRPARPPARRVLLLDDDSMVRALWLRIAEPLGVDLIAVETATQARAFVEVERYDLVVCDWRLGPSETSEAVVLHCATEGIPLVVMTGDPRALERLRGAHAVLGKPCHLAEVEAVLRGSEAAALAPRPRG
ncbi:MAG: response regulator [Sandaracinaceae bacterium]|nr:response regulator [Sandaracinaceae bacterium]